MSDDFGELSLFDLFKMEAEDNLRVLQDHLLAVERGEATPAMLEELMRSAHSMKGAARIIGLDLVVGLTHAMEDRFVKAQGGAAIAPEEVGGLLKATDWLSGLAGVEEVGLDGWVETNKDAIHALVAQLAPDSEHGAAETESEHRQASDDIRLAAEEKIPSVEALRLETEHDRENAFLDAGAMGDGSSRQQPVRLSAGGFDRILALASEALVLSNQISAMPETLDRNWRTLTRITGEIRALDAAGGGGNEEAVIRAGLRADWDRRFAEFEHMIMDVDRTARESQLVTSRLHTEILGGRLRPFSEGTAGFVRLVRDLAENMGKQVSLQIEGARTTVDREVLDKLKAPLTHLLQNAVDHATETPEMRKELGKPVHSTLLLSANHEHGQLVITLRDDGKGIDREQLKKRVLDRDLATAEMVSALSDAELLEFIFLPGFSTRTEVSEVSGRGFGLNVVQAMVHEAGGSVSVKSEAGVGTTFKLTLPVTRSMVRTVRVRAGSDTYAAPLVRIEAICVAVPEEREGYERLIVHEAGAVYPVVSLSSLLGQESTLRAGVASPMLLVGKIGGVAFQVDTVLDQVDLAIRKVDPRIGKIPGVSSVALDENGWPLLLLDMEALMQTALGVAPASENARETREEQAHILVVDDSATVREQVRRILVKAGYRVSTAQNGREAWNLLRTRSYDLLLSDVDMPQMNGIELVTKVRGDAVLERMHIVLLSYKDRPEDRQRGLDAGADYYLTKGSFQNETFLQAIVDLIGKGEPQ
jgi:two-component system, chemotaxis family, sensor histidine kinase and response regulator WspE